MKLLIVILNDPDAEAVLQALLEAEYRVTRVASTGGFLRRGNTTLMIGTKEELIDRALEIIRSNTTGVGKIGENRATVFVLPVHRFEQL
jgi:uncharacterized protein YaaQ